MHPPDQSLVPARPTRTRSLMQYDSLRIGGKSEATGWQRAPITGGASGIGRACALRFAQEGAAVCVADLNEAGAAETVRAIAAGGQALALRVDVHTGGRRRSDGRRLRRRVRRG